MLKIWTKFTVFIVPSSQNVLLDFITTTPDRQGQKLSYFMDKKIKFSGKLLSKIHFHWYLSKLVMIPFFVIPAAAAAKCFLHVQLCATPEWQPTGLLDLFQFSSSLVKVYPSFETYSLVDHSIQQGKFRLEQT